MIPKVQIDWKSFYIAFCQEHGDPIKPESGPYKGRLLFRDGWSYALAYPGPAYPPAEDYIQRRNDQRYYWTIRREQMRQVIHKLEGQINYLTELSQDHPDLMMLVEAFDENGKKTHKKEQVTIKTVLREMESALKTMEEDLLECDRELEELAEVDDGMPD